MRRREIERRLRGLHVLHAAVEDLLELRLERVDLGEHAAGKYRFGSRELEADPLPQVPEDRAEVAPAVFQMMSLTSATRVGRKYCHASIVQREREAEEERQHVRLQRRALDRVERDEEEEERSGYVCLLRFQFMALLTHERGRGPPRALVVCLPRRRRRCERRGQLGRPRSDRGRARRGPAHSLGLALGCKCSMQPTVFSLVEAGLRHPRSSRYMQPWRILMADAGAVQYLAARRPLAWHLSSRPATPARRVY